MTLAIVGLGTAVPATVITQEQGPQIAQRLGAPTPEQANRLRSICLHSGVRSRHVVLDGEVVQDILNGTRDTGSCFLPERDPEHRGPSTAQRMQHYAAMAGPLALAAAGRALGEGGVTARQITHLVTVSCTGFHAPGVDVELIRGLGLPAGTARTHIGYMGCHGALNGLRAASAFVGADPSARVLLCAVELCSLHYYYPWDFQRAIANALFADGAAAVVGVPAAIAAADSWQLRASGSCIFPDSADDMRWTVGDHGFAMTLSRRVSSLIAQHLRPWLAGWLTGLGLSLAQVGSWAVHPGGPRILGAVEEALDLPRPALEASRAVFAEKGNMSSPTVLFIIERLRLRAAARPCVALGFGPGLAVEAALFE
jgi:predicted naringenin-chalcone synthase